MLGASGAAIQAMFANPLASPDLTGTTSGAALGAVLTAYIFGFSSSFALSIGAVAGALGALLLLLALAGRRAETGTLLLAGLAISALAGALTTLALALAPSPFAFYDAYDWLLGSLVDRSLNQLLFAAVPALLAIALLLRLQPALDALTLGEEVAQSFGYDVARLRRSVVCLSALGVGACVAVCGAIGFIGLVAPIFARRLTGGHPGRAILPAAILGATLLLMADLATRLAPLGRNLPPAQRQRLFSYLPASRDVHWPLAVRDLIALGAPDEQARARIPKLLHDFDLAGLAGRRIDRISTGERSRVLIARALVAEPKLLLLDEPAANLDPLWQLRLMDHLRAYAQGMERTILIAVHDLELARQFADRLIIMDKGAVVADGNPANLLEGPDIPQVFGIRWSEGRWHPVV
jgi:iron complex transport system permease protein